MVRKTIYICIAILLCGSIYLNMIQHEALSQVSVNIIKGFRLSYITGCVEALGVSHLQICIDRGDQFIAPLLGMLKEVQ